ncbi:MAG: nucleotidyltransferase domain-containing protein [Deltaproteobacteria bacterium]|nr:nucleotidyltransferase domain-containing protein [Deltaproteobacteria bacterium]
MTTELLTEHQLAVARKVLAEESARREHLVISLSGAHAYGFPSPDSDLDLKAIHIAPTADLLRLGKPRLSFDRLEVIDGVEIDYTSNELEMALNGILKGNGNYLERVLGTSTIQGSSMLEALRPLAKRALSRQVHMHYRGFARSQLAEAQKGEATAKQVLYVLRTALTGTHLLLTGELVTDLGAICSGYGFADARALIDAKRAGERVVLPAAERDRWFGKLGAVLEALDAAREKSILPEQPTNEAELESWLLEVRRRSL